MTNEKLAKSILLELECGYISYGNLHGNNEQGLNLIKGALENQDRYKARTLRYGALEIVAMYDKKHDVYWMKCLSSEMLNALGYEVEE